MAESKQDRGGLYLIEYVSWMSSFDFIRDYRKKFLVADDGLSDASVLALAASSKNWRLLPLPDPPEYDSVGLPMRIIRPAREQ